MRLVAHRIGGRVKVWCLEMDLRSARRLLQAALWYPFLLGVCVGLG